MTKINNVHILNVDVFIRECVAAQSITIDKPTAMSFKFKTIESLQKVSEKLHKDLDSDSLVLTIGPDDFGKCESLDNEHIVRVSTNVQQDVEEIIEDAAFKKILERIEEVKRMLGGPPLAPWTPCIPPMIVYYGVTVSAYATPDIGGCGYDNNWTWTTSKLTIEDINPEEANNTKTSTTYKYSAKYNDYDKK
jgi:hypothetical protein